MEPIRTFPYVEKNIKDLDKQDIKIAISGIIINKEEESLILDDGTGQINVYISTDLPINTYIRILGRLLPFENGFELQGDIIQDFSKIDKLLYRKVKSLLQ